MKSLRGVIVFLAGSMLLISGTFYIHQILYTPNILVGVEDRAIIIPDSSTFEDLQRQLHDGGYIQDLVSFSFLARFTGYDEHLRPGRFLLRHDMGNMQALRFLRQGDQEPVTVTFNSVRLVTDLPAKITKNTQLTAADFQAALIDFTMTNSYGFNGDNILCMFIPNTYEVYYTISAAELIERMHREYEGFWNGGRDQKADSLGLSRMEVSILASIVQAETTKRSEGPIIAGLYLNRLRRGIALQADPTLVFASGNFSLKRVLDKHKEIDSPYNTYTHKGLPPGPINMPEIYFIDAVLNYTPSNYLFMCAREDFSGFHNFASTLSEHNNNARRYQRALSAEIRKGAQNRK